MQTITMLETRRGTEDGFTIRLYQSGQTYEVGDTLAYHFVSSDFARVGELNLQERKEVRDALAVKREAIRNNYPECLRGFA